MMTIAPMPLSRDEWLEHKLQDERQSEDISVLKLAMFGDATKPETVKQAVMPTMMRINAWLDAMCFAWKFLGAAVALIAALAAVATAVAKVMGWL